MSLEGHPAMNNVVSLQSDMVSIRNGAAVWKNVRMLSDEEIDDACRAIREVMKQRRDQASVH